MHKSIKNKFQQHEKHALNSMKKMHKSIKNKFHKSIKVSTA